jgi:hypothetical protein
MLFFECMCICSVFSADELYSFLNLLFIVELPSSLLSFILCIQSHIAAVVIELVEMRSRIMI